MNHSRWNPKRNFHNLSYAIPRFVFWDYVLVISGRPKNTFGLNFCCSHRPCTIVKQLHVQGDATRKYSQCPTFTILGLVFMMVLFFGLDFSNLGKFRFKFWLFQLLLCAKLYFQLFMTMIVQCTIIVINIVQCTKYIVQCL